MTRVLNITLLVLIVLLQAKWWFGHGGLREQWRLQQTVSAQQEENERLSERNQSLMAEVRDLKVGTEALEERARNEFGLVQHDEEFYQVVQRVVSR